MEGRLSREFSSIFNQNTFLKVKADSFPIGRVLFDIGEFNSKGGNKLIKNVPSYIEIGKALVFANDILTGRLPRQINEAKKKASDGGQKFIPHSWENLGGANEAEAGKYRKDGKAHSRVITLGAGLKKPYVFTAHSGPGTVDKNSGLIVPDYKNIEAKIFVACDVDQLKSLAIQIQTEWNAYLSAQYAAGAYIYHCKAG